MSFRFLLVLMVFAGCAVPVQEISIGAPQKTYPVLLEEFESCTGKGKLESRGPFKGKLTFTFMSQHDSSFFQFKDIMGRKALLLWLTPGSVSAWNVIENKLYNFAQILEFFPFLQVVEPQDITQFLWGVQPEYENKLKRLQTKHSGNIFLQFEVEKSNEYSNNLVNARFEDQRLKQSVEIRINKRNFSKTNVDLSKVWQLIQS